MADANTLDDILPTGVAVQQSSEFGGYLTTPKQQQFISCNEPAGFLHNLIPYDQLGTPYLTAADFSTTPMNSPYMTPFMSPFLQPAMTPLGAMIDEMSLKTDVNTDSLDEWVTNNRNTMANVVNEQAVDPKIYNDYI
jgi:hypothetical protein